MSDIVERLREVAERADANYPVIMQQAADTITALRAENERLNKSRNKWGQKYNKLLEKHMVTRAEMANQIQWAKDLTDNLIAEDAKTSALRAEVEKLRAVLALYREAVRIDATMEGPKFMGSNASALKRAWDADCAALEKEPEA